MGKAMWFERSSRSAKRREPGQEPRGERGKGARGAVLLCVKTLPGAAQVARPTHNCTELGTQETPMTQELPATFTDTPLPQNLKIKPTGIKQPSFNKFC